MRLVLFVIRKVCLVILLVLYRKLGLILSYANVVQNHNTFLNSKFSKYALYKAGCIDLQEFEQNCEVVTRFSPWWYKNLLSMRNPDLFFAKLTEAELKLLKENWQGINDYLSSYSLSPFVGINAWTTDYKTDDFRELCKHKVSILMTAKNASKTLEYAITSILNQTYQNFELIVVDDNSDDGTIELLSKIAKTDDRLFIIRLDQNHGTYRARNIALSHATGRYITTHDADDLMHPSHLNLLVNAIDDSPSKKASISYWVRFKEDGTVSLDRGFPLLRLNLSSFLFKREVLQDIPCWDEFPCGADLYFFSECIEKYGKHSIVYIKKPLSISLFSKFSLTATNKTGVFSMEGRRIRAKYEDSWRRRLIATYHPRLNKLLIYLERISIL